MPVNSKHPLYAHYEPDWTLMADTYAGERAVKNRGEIYLPATSGMVADGMSSADSKGSLAYKAYKTRAVFHDFVAEAVEAMVGVMHRKPAEIELPSSMQPMLANASTQGESLQLLLQRITEQQLVFGRLGLLVDLPATPTQDTPTPYIALYQAPAIINWDRGVRDKQVRERLAFLVLNESEYERNPENEWTLVEKYRLLQLMPKGGPTAGGKPVYQVAVVRLDNSTMPGPEQYATPSWRGRELEELPFVFINSKDVVIDPDDPPLLGLANLTIAIYRGEADYRQTLFMQGQDTLVVSGAITEGAGGSEIRVGANARIDLPVGGTAEYIGVGHEGISEQREALAADKTEAGQKGSQLMDNRSKEKEGHESLQIRVAAQTATLTQIAKSAAFGLELALKIVARWQGQDPEKVKVTPNLDFVDEPVTGKDLVDLVAAKNQGFPLSRESLHAWAVKHELTTLTYEEELDLIEGEEPIGTMTGAPMPDGSLLGLEPPDADDE